MLTLLGSLLGFLSSTFPDVIKVWRDKGDRKHELDVLKLQIESQKTQHGQRLEEIKVESQAQEMQALYQNANKNSGVRWVEGLGASVRPVITYAFFLLFMIVKIAALVKLQEQGVDILDSLIVIWDEETQALFAAVISFWFGQRALTKVR